MNIQNGQGNGIPIQGVQEDTISQISWAPNSYTFAASSWNGETRIWQSQGTNAQPKTLIKHENGLPALTTCFFVDGSKVFSGGADKKGMMIDLNTNQTQQVAQHDEAITGSKFINGPNNMGPILATGGHDKTLRFWDLKSPKEIFRYACQDKVNSIDSRGFLLVAGLCDNQFNLFDIRNPQQPQTTHKSSFEYQATNVACFPDGNGFIYGSIDGRCQIQHIQPNNTETFSFKCHRNGTNVYSVNSVCFNPAFGSFATCGSDGAFAFWDRFAKSRLKNFAAPPVNPTPITACAFSEDGRMFAYARGNDWSLGAQASQQKQYKTELLLLQCNETDVKLKGK